MTEPVPTVSRLWKNLSPAQRVAASTAFWKDEEAVSDQAQAVMLIAQQKKFRPKTVVALDVERKARHLASVSNLPEALAARALIVYHLAERRPMMGAFLDALGIKHEDGLINEEIASIDQAKLGAAVALIGGQYPAADVALYLNTLLCQDPEAWAGLAGVMRELKAGDRVAE
jgi:hypothetical protein